MSSKAISISKKPVPSFESHSLLQTFLKVNIVYRHFLCTLSMASLLSHLPPIHILQHLILLILIQIPPCLSSYDYYRSCSNLISCGSITNIGFPFWGQNRSKECGHPLMQLICQNDISYIAIKDVKYQVLNANPNEHTLKITRVDYLQEGICPSKHVNTTLDTELFVYGPGYKNLTLFYGCAASNALPSTSGFLPCTSNETSGEYVYPQLGSSLPHVFCKTSVFIPVSSSLIDSNINDVIKIHHASMEGFVVRWIVGTEECKKCETASGVCGIDLYSNGTTCYCKDGPCSKLSSDAEAPAGMSKFIGNNFFFLFYL